MCPDFKDLSQYPEFQIDLRYATENNFLGTILYGDLKQCFLHVLATEKLLVAARELTKLRSGWKILVFDGLRPRSVQQRMWEKVKDTPQEKYIGNPANGSVHNYGLAVDVSLSDSQSLEVDMGAAFDHFGPEAEPAQEENLLKAGILTPNQIENRLLLRKVMEHAGFIQLPWEWWHYDALPAEEVRRQYQAVE